MPYSGTATYCSRPFVAIILRMPRVARIVVSGVPHHVTQRGNNRQDVFFVDDDRALYLKILTEESQRHGLAILGYCLMTNHTHLVAVPQQADSLARALGRTHWRYTQAVNRLHGRSGHLWQNRFHSAALDVDHTLNALLYVERNPIRAGLCRAATRYTWSSATAHVKGEDKTGVLDLKWFARHFDGKEWRDKLAAGLPEAEEIAIRTQTNRGRPLASDKWIAKLETKLGRRLRPQPVGRPPGSKTKKKRRRK